MALRLQSAIPAPIRISNRSGSRNQALAMARVCQRVSYRPSSPPWRHPARAATTAVQVPGRRLVLSVNGTRHGTPIAGEELYGGLL